ncbi:MAG TPA: tRNA (guanosine(46)-N7)-methyltransferase TrmB [Desulfurivibrionaceae bacterium]|nr:tRNA (guanosine(46)-N7)-methyltransferase TrmB [Desulfurivibrionaceae bacterium]
MPPACKRALEELWQDYGVSEPGELDLAALFGRTAPCHLEIGFGLGDALLEMACLHPENNYLGFEVYLPGVGQLLLDLHESGVTNVRLDRRNVMEGLDLLPAGSLERVYLFFPDPWPKTRHHKRRLVQSSFVAKLRRVLAPGGHFHAATDCASYAQQICEVMAGADGFRNCAGGGSFYQGPVERPVTKFAKRALTQGQEISELLFVRG